MMGWERHSPLCILVRKGLQVFAYEGRDKLPRTYGSESFKCSVNTEFQELSPAAYVVGQVRDRNWLALVFTGRQLVLYDRRCERYLGRYTDPFGGFPWYPKKAIDGWGIGYALDYFINIGGRLFEEYQDTFIPAPYVWTFTSKWTGAIVKAIKLIPEDKVERLSWKEDQVTIRMSSPGQRLLNKLAEIDDSSTWRDDVRVDRRCW